MLTPDEIEDRRIYLASLSTGDGPLQPDAPHATVNNRRWFRRIDGAPVPTSARRRLHEQILEQWRAANPHVARERSAIVMAGPPGAGKSSTHEHLFRGRDPRRWRELDADVFKRYLLEAALADGTFEELVPPELRAAPGEGSRFYPFELSALVHRESTDFLFAAAQRDAVADGENLIIDGTLAWKGHAERLLTHLQQAGYTIHVVDVEAPQHVAAERIVTRWRHGLLGALGDPADPPARLGGRWVPATAVDALFTEFREPDHLPLHGRSVTQVNALEVSEAHTAVGCYDLYRTEDAGRGADHVERRERSDADGELCVTWTADSTPVG
ncbi:zeta toxin family protein [Rhodococcus artemisiae]|uniref:Zeta toxin family protein n=1 Tax=Rhodococcus artemisiae TaxID=714159 RepID=A0ABU7LJC1_9NOCA|nr:zeta toxin family protein [Rhodococcus artemisiae]MEE2061601.1 zeta toxin family protein [Rhodococcus artemisiae]